MKKRFETSGTYLPTSETGPREVVAVKKCCMLTAMIWYVCMYVCLYFYTRSPFGRGTIKANIVWPHNRAAKREIKQTAVVANKLKQTKRESNYAWDTIVEEGVGVQE